MCFSNYIVKVKTTKIFGIIYENKNMLFTNSSLNKALKINKQLEDASEACGIYGRWLAEMVAEQKCPNIQAVGKFNNSNVYRFGLEKK